MSLIKMKNKQRPIIIVGKSNKNCIDKALGLLSNSDNPIVRYADEYDIEDNYSLPRNRGLIIREVNIKPKTDLIIKSILEYRGTVILTSSNQKDVPKSILKLVKLTRATSDSEDILKIKEISPRSNPPKEYDLDIFKIMMDYLKNPDREDVLEILKINKPSDSQLLSWLGQNVHPNKLMYIDSEVKRKWSSDYFYELLAYSHEGKTYGKLVMPKRRPQNEMRDICRRLKLKREQQHLLKHLLEDDEFRNYAKSRLDNRQCRLLKLGEKKKVKIKQPTVVTTKLDKWL